MKILLLILFLHPLYGYAQKQDTIHRVVRIKIIEETPLYSKPIRDTRYVLDTLDPKDRNSFIIGLRKYMMHVNGNDVLVWHVGNLVDDGYIMDNSTNLEYDTSRLYLMKTSTYPPTQKERDIDKKNLEYFRNTVAAYIKASKKEYEAREKLKQTKKKYLHTRYGIE